MKLLASILSGCIAWPLFFLGLFARFCWDEIRSGWYGLSHLREMMK